MNGISKNKIYAWIGMLAVVVVLGFVLARLNRNSIDISGAERDKTEKSVGGISGLECESANSRPLAVMLSSDKETRPLSGIGEADMVFEMPVVENGFTRMMAVYQCGRPKELGSIRSARIDFLPLVLGLDAIYAHFGGEQTALAELNAGTIDNIDGLKYDGTIYYRKNGIPRPHNAFTDMSLISQAVLRLGYDDQAAAGAGYPHEQDSRSRGEAQPEPLFSQDFRVAWKYDKTANSYFRSRSGQPEMDKNTGKQVEAKNVIVMKTTWSPVSKDYIRVKTVGSGGLLVYKNGQVVSGSWEKKTESSKLYFYDVNRREIPLAPGAIWVEIVTN